MDSCSKKETAKLEMAQKPGGKADLRGSIWPAAEGPSCLPTRPCDKCPPTVAEAQLSPEGCEHVGWKPEAHRCRGTSVRGNLIISAVGTGALGSTAALSCGLGSCLLWKPCQGSFSCQWRPRGAAGLEKCFCITVVNLSF